MGEFVTSYDMAGVSLTLFWLDDELEAYWTRAGPLAGLPQRRRWPLPAAPPQRHAEPGTRSTPAQAEQHDRRPATPPACGRARSSARWPRSATASTTTPQALGDIDAVAGDGDHGIGMQRGAHAAADAAAAAWRGAGAGRCWWQAPTPGPTAQAERPARCGDWACAPSAT